MGVYTTAPYVLLSICPSRTLSHLVRPDSFLGPVAGPIFSGFINQHLNWRWTWYILIMCVSLPLSDAGELICADLLQTAQLGNGRIRYAPPLRPRDVFARTITQEESEATGCWTRRRACADGTRYSLNPACHRLELPQALSYVPLVFVELSFRY
jgi:MFS family permease